MIRILVTVCISILATSSFASIEYDQSVAPEVIFGTGNLNGGFARDQGNGLELGLRAKVRFPTPLNQFNSDGLGTYVHLAGNDTGRPLWSFEWTINTSWDGTKNLRFLRDVRYELRIDSDPSASTNFLVFDPINSPNPVTGYWDHAIGDQFTGNGGGMVAGDQATYNGLIASKHVAQNSWRMDFFPFAFNPSAAGIYTFELAGFTKGSTDPTPIAATSMVVVVENIGVPEPMSLLAWSGLIACALVAVRRHPKS
jgi:hypothetical protein